jgi:hypothetical protein
MKPLSIATADQFASKREFAANSARDRGWFVQRVRFEASAPSFVIGVERICFRGLNFVYGLAA